MRLTTGTLAAKWAEIVSQALLVLILPRALGPGGYGEFAVAFAVVTVLSVSLGLGAPLAAIRFVPGAAPADQLAVTRAVGRSVAISRVWILGAVTVGAAALAPPLLDVPLTITLVVCAAGWCSVASSIASELGLALGRPGVWNLRFPVENLLVVAAASAGYALGGADGAVVGMAMACAATFLLLFTRLSGELRAAAAGASLPPGTAVYARLETISVLLGTLIKRGGPLAMGIAGASNVETGFAAIATGVGAAGAAAMLDLLIVQIPRLVTLRGRSAAMADREAAGTAWFALLVAMLTALPAAVLAGPAIRVLLGASFAGARGAVVLALPGVPLGAVMGLATAASSLYLRPAALAVGWAIGGSVFAGTAVATIGALQAKGAAVAMSAGLLAAAVSVTLLIGGRDLRRLCVVAALGAGLVLAAGLLAR